MNIQEPSVTINNENQDDFVNIYKLGIQTIKELNILKVETKLGYNVDTVIKGNTETGKKRKCHTHYGNDFTVIHVDCHNVYVCTICLKQFPLEQVGLQFQNLID